MIVKVRWLVKISKFVSFKQIQVRWSTFTRAVIWLPRYQLILLYLVSNFYRSILLNLLVLNLLISYWSFNKAKHIPEYISLNYLAIIAVTVFWTIFNNLIIILILVFLLATIIILIEERNALLLFNLNYLIRSTQILINTNWRFILNINCTVIEYLAGIFIQIRLIWNLKLVRFIPII